MTPSSDPPAGASADSEERHRCRAPPLPDGAIVPGAVAPALAAIAPARKRPRPGERRVQILETLATMLQEPGAERVTTAALAAKLSVSEAALYRHFASKAQMFEGLIEFIEQSVFTLVNQIVEREADGGMQVQRSARRAAPVRREESGHDAGDGRRCAGLRERAAADPHEPVLRAHRVAAAPEPAPARRRRRLGDAHRRRQRAGFGADRVRDRSPARDRRTGSALRSTATSSRRAVTSPT